MGSVDRGRYGLQCALLFFAFATVLIGAEENVKVLIREKAQVSGPSVELGEIADIQAPAELTEKLQNLTIADSPTPGANRTIYSYHIQTCLQRSELVSPSQIAFAGKPHVVVQAIAEEISSASPMVPEPDSTQRIELVKARHPLPRNHLIKPGDIVLADGEAKKSSLVGKRLVRAIPVDGEITSQDVVNTFLVHYGEEIRLLIHRGALRVSTTARALETASYGQTVRVQNLKSGEEQFGTVTDSKQVVLCLDPNVK